jgi:hypothetical protein
MDATVLRERRLTPGHPIVNSVTMIVSAASVLVLGVAQTTMGGGAQDVTDMVLSVGQVAGLISFIFSAWSYFQEQSRQKRIDDHDERLKALEEKRERNDDDHILLRKIHSTVHSLDKRIAVLSARSVLQTHDHDPDDEMGDDEEDGDGGA